ncbi:hypothetical protein GCM10009712_08240 [Pseudarthrobacter sulfonivorans]
MFQHLDLWASSHVVAPILASHGFEDADRQMSQGVNTPRPSAKRAVPTFEGQQTFKEARRDC